MQTQHDFEKFKKVFVENVQTTFKKRDALDKIDVKGNTVRFTRDISFPIWNTDIFLDVEEGIVDTPAQARGT